MGPPSSLVHTLKNLGELEGIENHFWPCYCMEVQGSLYKGCIALMKPSDFKKIFCSITKKQNF